MGEAGAIGDIAPRRSTLSAGLVIAPALLTSILFLVAPMAAILINSLTVTTAGSTNFTFAHYWAALSDSYYWEVLWRTTRISVITTLVTLLLAYPTALHLYFSESRWRRVMLFVVISPLFLSVVVRTYGWVVLLGGDGPINALLPEGQKLQLLRTEGAVVLGLMHIYIPFMVLALHAALVKVDRKLLAAAASLGASNLRMFRDILWPLSVPGVMSGSMIVFAISMTAFATPVLLGGAANKTTPYLIYQQNLMLADWHMGSALAFILLAATLLGVSLIRRLAQRATPQEIR